MQMLKLFLAATLSVAASTPAQAQASPLVDVAFVPQGRFVDAGVTQHDIERTQAALSAHLQALGKRWLAPGTQLRLEVTGIDLAGQYPMGRTDRPRVLKGAADWPRIELRYELTRADGQVERATASVSDLNYLSRGPGLYGGETLAHEKRMLDEWFRGRFASVPG
jgi:hypothetical protein